MKEMNKIYKIRIKKGDNVVVLVGREKGKTGTVVTTHPRTNQATVTGINIVKKHLKKTQDNQTGGIIEVTKPINVSKIAFIDPESKKPSRIGYKMNADGKKVRVLKSSGKEIK